MGWWGMSLKILVYNIYCLKGMNVIVLYCTMWDGEGKLM